MTGWAAAVWDEVLDVAAHVTPHHNETRSQPEMTALSDVQSAFDAYVAAVNAKLAELHQDTVDLDPLAQSIADATAALNPAPADPAPAA